MIKLLIIFLFVIGAFAIMLLGMFFGDYKKVKTKYEREKGKLNTSPNDENFSSCAGCTGTGCHK